MKNLKKLSWILLSVLLISHTVSCKKKEKEIDYQALLKESPWNLLKIVEYDAATGQALQTNMFQNAVVIYKDNGKYDFKVNGNPVITDGIYQFIRDAEPMKLIMDGDSFIIIVFEEDELVLESEDKTDDYEKIYMSR